MRAYMLSESGEITHFFLHSTREFSAIFFRRKILLRQRLSRHTVIVMPGESRRRRLESYNRHILLFLSAAGSLPAGIVFDMSAAFSILLRLQNALYFNFQGASIFLYAELSFLR